MKKVSNHGDGYAHRSHSVAGTGADSLPSSFAGIIDGGLSSDVNHGDGGATVDSTATNTPPHIPQGGPFHRRQQQGDHQDGKRDEDQWKRPETAIPLNL